MAEAGQPSHSAAREGLPEYALASAARIVLVVHGVGDPSPVDIVEQARKGFLASRADHGAVLLEATRVAIVGVGALRQEALRVRTPHGDHVILPVVWSRFRERFVAAFEEDSKRFTAFRILGAITDVARCVPVAADRWARLPLRVLSWLVAAVALVVFVCALLGLELQAMALALAVDHIFDLDGWRENTAVLASIVVAGLGAVLVAAGLDLSSDVAAFVGQPDHRRRVIGNLTGLLQLYQLKSPDAELIIVGHSLGSVLVTHAAVEAHRTKGAAPLSLITLGSPLNLLSTVFPSVIREPRALAEAFQESGKVRLWLNLWRDWDVIGRELRGRNPLLLQQPLGDGPHGNYWKDPRLWATLVRVLATESLTPEAVVEVLRSDDLYADEQAEARRARRVHVLIVATCAIGATAAALGWWNAYAVAGLDRVLDGRLSAALRQLWWPIAGAGAVALLSFAPWLTAARIPRDRLGQLRFWRRPALAGWLVWLVATTAFGANVFRLAASLP